MSKEGFANQVVMITGAASGFGKILDNQLARRGPSGIGRLQHGGT